MSLQRQIKQVMGFFKIIPMTVPLCGLHICLDLDLFNAQPIITKNGRPKI